jgi:intein-encoded DNA endonuclease-like protein
MSISIENKIKNQQNKIDAKKFINFCTPEHVYLLGFIWADGHLYTDSMGRHRITIEITQADMTDIKPVIDLTGKWSFVYRNRANRNPQVCASCSNDLLADFLIEHKYKFKSTYSPCIYNDIPSDLKHYFLRGLFDGDGSFYYNQKSHSRQFSVTSSYNQDWSLLETVFTSLGIKFSIKRTETNVVNKHNKTNSYSQIRITSKRDIKKLHDMIYSDHYDEIGLKRKYEKSVIIINS